MTRFRWMAGGWAVFVALGGAAGKMSGTMDGPSLADVLAHIWRFVRGDTPVPKFEEWCHETAALEQVLGKALYMQLISTRFGDPEELHRMRSRLRDFAQLKSELRCQCVTVADRDIIDMGERNEFFATLDERKKRGKPWWWLHLEVCRVCGQGWLVAQEERQNDIFCLRRLDEQTVAAVIERSEWPPDFDRYETLLRMGSDAGRAVTFLDPIGDSSLKWTIADLAQERPGISVSELCDLLNIEREIAETIAWKVVAEQSAKIRFD